MKELSMKSFIDVAKISLSESTLYDKAYPKALAKFIKQCTPPLTIALQGEWGSGKTSMMNMVKDILKESDVEFMDFNAWLFSQFNLGDQLPLILLTHLSQEAGFDNKIKDILSKVAISTVHFLGKKFGGTDNFMTPLAPDDIEQLKNLKKTFENAVQTKLNKEGKEKLLIFIDDIDRVEPKKAIELLESIKLFCECKGCIFVLAVDSEVIFKGANDKFGNEKGKAFFDKIIQVPFNMPTAINNFEGFMKKLIEDFITDIDDENIIKNVSKFYIDISEIAIGSNPRSIKRLLNAFVISDYVAQEQGTYCEGDILNNYIRLLLYSLLCIESYNNYVYEYLIDKAEVINDGCIDKLISDVRDIFLDKTVEEEFYEYVELDGDSFDKDIISIFVNILQEIKINNINEDTIKRIFNVSSSAITNEKKVGKPISESFRKFNDVCNEKLSVIYESLRKKYRDKQFYLRKGSSMQHKPHILIQDKNSQATIGFICVYNKSNPSSVNLTVQYWQANMKNTNASLYEKVKELNLSDDISITTTGTTYRNVIQFDIDNFNKYEEYIVQNIDKTYNVFNN